MSHKTILVTGGAGYVGAHACKALANAGFDPVVFDNLERGHRWAVKWGPLEIGDVRDTSRLLDVLKQYRPSAALHFAALAYVGESVTEPENYYDNNVVGSLSLLRALRQEGVMNIVFSSSCATYGIPETTPISEQHRQTPVNPYGKTKLVIEGALSDYASAYGFHYANLRYFNAAGADIAGEIGEDHDPETHAIPLAILTATGKRSYFEIYGTDYPTDDGTAVRDYIHVADLANAHVLALRHLLSGGESVSLNLGTGQGYSVRQIIAAVEAVSGKPVPLNEGPRRPGDPPILIADPAAAFQRLNWKPDHSDLLGIVGSAFNWHRLRD